MRISDWSSDVCSSDLYNIALAHPVVDQFAAPVRTDHEQGRNLALADPGGKFDEHLGAVVEGANRTPRCNRLRSEEHTSELQSLMRISYAVFCLKKKKKHTPTRESEKSQLRIKTHNTVSKQQKHYT